MLALKFCSGFGEGKQCIEDKKLRFTIYREMGFFHSFNICFKSFF